MITYNPIEDDTSNLTLIGQSPIILRGSGGVTSLERTPKMGNKGVKQHKGVKEITKFNDKEQKQIKAIFDKICGRRSSTVTATDTGDREFEEDNLKASRSAPLTLTCKMEVTKEWFSCFGCDRPPYLKVVFSFV